MSSLPDLTQLISDIDAKLSAVQEASPESAVSSTVAAEESTKYLLVGIGGLRLAIAIDNLSEVGPLPTITFLPNLPPWIQGIVNIRSEIISVIDFAGFLGLADRDVCAGNRMAVLRYKKRKIGLRLDQIFSTVNRTLSEQKPLDGEGQKGLDTTLFPAVFEVDNARYYILNVRRFLTAPRLIDYNTRG